MHHYTPQQMTGHKGYRPCTFVGNYSEDISLDECRVRDHSRLRAEGKLPAQQLQRQMVTHLSEVGLTPQHEDGFIHFGDFIMVQSSRTKGFLSIDLGTVLEPMCFGVSTAESAAPVARNTFVIDHPPRSHAPYEDKFFKQAGEDHILHYGQPFVLRCPNLHPDTSLFLQSHQVSPHLGRVSKVSKKQEVSAFADNSKFDVCWKVLSADIRALVQTESCAVPANAVVTLCHGQTNQLLSSDLGKLIHNSFGSENEVCCFRWTGIATTAVKNCEIEPPNLWALVTAPTGAQLREYHEATFKDTTAIVSKVKARILQRAGQGRFRSLVRVMRTMDADGNQQLTLEELVQGLQTYGIFLSGEEARAVMRAFDKDHSGTVSITEFLREMRGPMCARRCDIVMQAYGKLDKDHNGRVTFDDLLKIYSKNVERHPEVQNGTKTAAKVIIEFTSDWDKNGDGEITKEEFLDYYTDLSVNIDDDDYFELMVRNAWHISGGKGWSQNTTCRRVLVIHTDGRQTVEEIKDDLGIGPNDLQAMKENLIAQGITDIKELKLKM